MVVLLEDGRSDAALREELPESSLYYHATPPVSSDLGPHAPIKPDFNPFAPSLTALVTAAPPASLSQGSKLMVNFSSLEPLMEDALEDVSVTPRINPRADRNSGESDAGDGRTVSRIAGAIPTGGDGGGGVGGGVRGSDHTRTPHQGSPANSQLGLKGEHSEARNRLETLDP